MDLSFVRAAGELAQGQLSYDSANQEFAFESFNKPALEGSLVAQYLQLFVEAESHKVSWAAGRSAQTSWQNHSLGVPLATDGVVRVLASSEPLRPGIAVEVPGAWGWVNSIDTDTGWFRSGSVNAADGTDLVRIAPGTVLELDGDSLASIWLRPAG